MSEQITRYSKLINFALTSGDKLAQFSMIFIDMVTKKQDGRRGFNAYSQQGYLTNCYIFRSETMCKLLN